MRGWRDRRRFRKLGEGLQKLHDYTQARIEAGDLDFDDWIYRTRDATRELLELHFADND